jgi:methylated-DNA-[protein]-cysteine S-methyltransferase
MTCTYKVIESPIGKLKLVASATGLAAILWENDDPDRVRLDRLVEQPGNPILVETERQLRDYFAGKLKAFTVPLDFNGTPFQRQVWQALLTIPFGETRSYGDIARQIGRPTASRAVGAANRKNPISIIAPCHRVIGSTGKLTGFAGGLPAKQHLLGLEHARSDLQLAG